MEYFVFPDIHSNFGKLGRSHLKTGNTAHFNMEFVQNEEKGGRRYGNLPLLVPSWGVGVLRSLFPGPCRSRQCSWAWCSDRKGGGQGPHEGLRSALQDLQTHWWPEGVGPGGAGLPACAVGMSCGAWGGLGGPGGQPGPAAQVLRWGEIPNTWCFPILLLDPKRF